MNLFILAFVTLSLVSCLPEQETVQPSDSNYESVTTQKSPERLMGTMSVEAQVSNTDFFRKVDIKDSIDLGVVDLIEAYGVNPTMETQARSVVRYIKLVNDSNTIMTIKSAKSSRGVQVFSSVFNQRVYPGEKYRVPLIFDGSQENFFGENLSFQVERNGQLSIIPMSVRLMITDKFGTVAKIRTSNVEFNEEEKEEIVVEQKSKALDAYEYQFAQLQKQMEIIAQQQLANTQSQKMLENILKQQAQKYERQIAAIQESLIAREKQKVIEARIERDANSQALQEQLKRQRKLIADLDQQVGNVQKEEVIDAVVNSTKNEEVVNKSSIVNNPDLTDAMEEILSPYYPKKEDNELGFLSDEVDPRGHLKRYKSAYTRYYPTSSPRVIDQNWNNFEVSQMFCGIKADTSLWCAGKPGAAVYIGNGAKRTDGSFKQILSSGVTSVVTNQDFSCAIQNEKLMCWGMTKNNSQETSHWLFKVPHLDSSSIGVANDGYALRPVEVISAGVKNVKIGHNRSCAILTGGELRCWGQNYGVTPVTVFKSGVKDILLGPYLFSGTRSCARMNDDSLKCWEDKATPVIRTVLNSGELYGASSVSVGLLRICYVKSKSIYCNRDQSQNEKWANSGTIKVNGDSFNIKIDTPGNYGFRLAHLFTGDVKEVFSFGVQVFAGHTDGSLSKTGTRDGIRKWFYSGTDVVANASSFKTKQKNSILIGINSFNVHESGLNNLAYLCFKNSHSETICRQGNKYKRILFSEEFNTFKQITF